jgi:plastocyanin
VYFADRMIGPTWPACVVAALALGAGPPASASAPAPVHDVRMLLTDDGHYVFQPAELTIRSGDRVRWINVSGGPHNVEFFRDSIPAGAFPVLNAAMNDRLGGQDLVGKLLFDDAEVYEISFAGAPAGTYAYVCTPHAAAGMNARLTVIP